jgi:hypothetical protein
MEDMDDIEILEESGVKMDLGVPGGSRKGAGR